MKKINKYRINNTYIVSSRDYKIISYAFHFFRKSKNIYEDIRLVCFFEYKGVKHSVPFYWHCNEIIESERMIKAKELCKKYNAPRHHFWKKLTEKEFFEMANEIGLKGLSKDRVEGQIEFGILNEHFTQ